LQPVLPSEAGKVGRSAQDNRQLLNAVFWILRTGAPWAGSVARLRGLEEHPSPVSPLAGPGTSGPVT
jgi:transposase